jgi:hypothetical protein
MRCHICQDACCASIRREDAWHMSGSNSRLCMSLPSIGGGSMFSSPLSQDKSSPNPFCKSYIIATLLLLQTIGLFHQDPQQRAQSNIIHGIVIQVCIMSFCDSLRKAHVSQMVRQNCLIEKSAMWEHQVLQVLPIQDPAALDVMWHEWAIHENIKRYLLVFSLKARAYQS